jgi:antimicrobial peptide system SdpA family protein
MTSVPSSPAAPPAPVRGDGALGALAVGLAAFWLAVIVYAVHPALPYSAVRLPSGPAQRAAALVPQGWAFFTRDPREEKQTVYVRGPGGWRPVLLAPHGSARNAFGFRRTSRAQGVEMALLAVPQPDSAYVDCSGPVAACLATLPRGAAVRSVSPAPTMCGTVAVVNQEPLPWAWLPSRGRVTMPSRILPLEVAC